MAFGFGAREKAGRQPAESGARPRSGVRARRSGKFRRGAPPELILIPQDLRTADPSFFAELSAGTMGLAGAAVSVSGGSPFRVDPPSREWHAALLGFGWLSDLKAVGTLDGRALACRTVEEWLAQGATSGAMDWSPAIAARRLISWLSNGDMLTEDASPEAYDRVLAGCDLHMRKLATMVTSGEEAQSLLVPIALVMGGLCLTEQDKLLAQATEALRTALASQILPDGGHISRDPGTPVEILLDLLPLRQCFLARERKPPAWLVDALERMPPMLRHLQLGDRGLARFNGMSATAVDRLATALSYSVNPDVQADAGAASGYTRLSRRATTVIIDAGLPPPRDFSAEAHAGALSFEMSSGTSLMIVNAGAPGPAAQAWRRQSRGTPAHSTLLLNDTSSARLIAVDVGEAGQRDLMAGPTTVESKYGEPGDGAAEIQGFHNGYQQRYGMLHARVLRLSAHGDKLSGIDRIFQPQRRAGQAGNKGDLTYSLHFHMHPQARLRYTAEAGTAEIELRNGEVWKFSASGSKLGIEDSLFFAQFTGPLRSVQIVLRGHVLADTQVRWTLERRHPPPEPQLPY